MSELDYKAAIEQCGFDCVGECPASELHVRAEVRDMCAADRCQMYEKNWACPPHCGTIEDFASKFSQRTTCYVLQTVGELEDEFDVEGMLAAEELQGERMRKLAGLVADNAKAMVLDAGPCTLCPDCTCPDAPCRFPDKRLVSMESSGLVVSDVCTSAGIPYNHGRGKMAYTGCLIV